MLGFNAIARLPLAFSSSDATAFLAATDPADTAAVALTAKHTAALAATDPADTAAFGLTATHTAALAATDPADTASISLTPSLVLAATDPADTAAFGLTATHTAGLAATDPADTAAVALTAKHTASLAATDPADTAAVALTAKHTAALAATEPADTASVAITNVVAPAPLQVPYGGWPKKRRPPKVPPPVAPKTVVIDEAVIRQMEAERLAALDMVRRQEALERLSTWRGPVPAAARKSVTLGPRAAKELPPLGSVERKLLVLGEIRRSAVTLFPPAVTAPPNVSKTGVITLARRQPVQPVTAQAHTITLRRSSDRMLKTG